MHACCMHSIEIAICFIFFLPQKQFLRNEKNHPKILKDKDDLTIPITFDCELEMLQLT